MNVERKYNAIMCIGHGIVLCSNVVEKGAENVKMILVLRSCIIIIIAELISEATNVLRCRFTFVCISGGLAQ